MKTKQPCSTEKNAEGNHGPSVADGTVYTCLLTGDAAFDSLANQTAKQQAKYEHVEKKKCADG